MRLEGVFLPVDPIGVGHSAFFSFQETVSQFLAAAHAAPRHGELAMTAPGLKRTLFGRKVAYSVMLWYKVPVET
jgi:hypothetical protein